MLRITDIRVLSEVNAALGDIVELHYGETLRVTTTFEYKGEEKTVTLNGAVGKAGTALVSGQTKVNLAASDVFTIYTPAVDIPITEDIDVGTGYDIYIKILEVAGAGAPEVDGVVNISGEVPPEPEKKTNWLPWAIAGGAAVVVGVGVAFATSKKSPKTPKAR